MSNLATVAPCALGIVYRIVALITSVVTKTRQIVHYGTGSGSGDVGVGKCRGFMSNNSLRTKKVLFARTLWYHDIMRICGSKCTSDNDVLISGIKIISSKTVDFGQGQYVQ